VEGNTTTHKNGEVEDSDNEGGIAYVRRSDGDDTEDTDKEEEDLKRRVKEAKKKGVKLVHRASFKRDRVDRTYDKWVIISAFIG